MHNTLVVWHLKHEGVWEAFTPSVSHRIEEAFCSFWRSGASSPLLSLCESEQAGGRCFIDFRTLEQTSTLADGSLQICTVCREDILPPIPPGSGFEEGQVRLEWGYAQDPIQNVGFAAYSAATNSLLETSYSLHRAGAGLKGALFEAENGCDYLVDFVKMHQTRMATRRTRHVYRHSVSRGIRMGVEASTKLTEAPASGAVAEPAAEKPIKGKTFDGILSLPLSRAPTSCSDAGSTASEEIESQSENDAEFKRLQVIPSIPRHRQVPAAKLPRRTPPNSTTSVTCPPQSKSNSNAESRHAAPAPRTSSLFACMASLASFCSTAQPHKR